MKASHDCHIVLLVASCVLFPLLGACEADSKHETEREVMAKVNGDVITARDLNDQVSRIASRAGLDKKIGKRQVLDALVDEKLLVQRASERGFDREPETIAALERARRQILAQAAIDHATVGSQGSNRETRAFYESHPDLFERRKTYVFRRFELLAGDLQPSIKAELDTAESPAQVNFILKRAKVGFDDQTEIRAAEMLPAEVLARAAEMQQGDILIIKEGRQIVLMQLVRSIMQPVDLAKATPAIRTYLAEEKRKNTAESLLRDLRQSAKIEYSEELIDGAQVQADAVPSGPVQDARARKDVTRVSTVRPRR